MLGISIVLKVILRNSPGMMGETTIDDLTVAIYRSDRKSESGRGSINFHPFEKQLKNILHRELFHCCALKTVEDAKF